MALELDVIFEILPLQICIRILVFHFKCILFPMRRSVRKRFPEVHRHSYFLYTSSQNRVKLKKIPNRYCGSLDNLGKSWGQVLDEA